MSDSREAMRAAVEALEESHAALMECDRDGDYPLMDRIDAALSLLRAALEAREERCTYPECSCEQPEHGGCGHPRAYTDAIGEAGEEYHRQFTHAHPLPAQWRWSELWCRMLAASPAAATQGDARMLWLAEVRDDFRRMADEANRMLNAAALEELKGKTE